MSDVPFPAFRIERVLDATSDGPMFGLVRAFIKDAEPTHFETVNEHVCARLAHAIGLPCPPGGFASRPEADAPSWISPQVRSPSPPPVDPVEIGAHVPSFCAGVLAFDTWVLNLDRHEWNIVYGPAVGPWIIDHGQALFYRGRDPQSVLDGAREQPMIGHLFHDLASPDLVRDWCRRIARVDREVIAEAVSTPARLGLVNESHAVALVDFLVHRAGALEHLVPSRLRSADTEGGEGLA